MSARRRIQFVFEDQRVERDVATDSALVQSGHDLGEFFQAEADFGAR